LDVGPAGYRAAMIAVLSAELEAALLRELMTHYFYEARARFEDRLRPAVIRLSDAEGRLGRWVSATRTIELSRRLVVTGDWLAITSVLEHEMAHQYVEEVLGVVDQSAHGEAFRRVCTERGIDGRAAGAPAPSSGPESEAAHALDRIRKLLALAGSPNQHEAELAMKKAHELMLRHNIDWTKSRVERGFELRHLGNPEKRTTRVVSEIARLLADCCFVKVVFVPVYLPHLGKAGQVLEVMGTQANVEMAAHVYEFLIATAARLWQENRGDARVRGGRDRLAYQAGVIDGFREKLRGERQTLATGHGLVWVGDRKLDAFYRQRHPRLRTRRSWVRKGGAHQAGREAGGKVVLHKPITSTTASGRLLGG
jgi:Protein of unknown function (DUF2786)/SprT-like family